MPGKQVAAGRPGQRAFSADCRRGRPAGVGKTTLAVTCVRLAGEPRKPASGATVTRLSRCWPSGALVAILLPGLDDAAFPARTMVSCCGATPEPWPGSPAGDRWPYVNIGDGEPAVASVRPAWGVSGPFRCGSSSWPALAGPCPATGPQPIARASTRTAATVKEI